MGTRGGTCPRAQPGDVLQGAAPAHTATLVAPSSVSPPASDFHLLVCALSQQTAALEHLPFPTQDVFVAKSPLCLPRAHQAASVPRAGVFTSLEQEEHSHTQDVPSPPSYTPAMGCMCSASPWPQPGAQPPCHTALTDMGQAPLYWCWCLAL